MTTITNQLAEALRDLIRAGTDEAYNAAHAKARDTLAAYDARGEDTWTRESFEGPPTHAAESK